MKRRVWMILVTYLHMMTGMARAEEQSKPSDEESKAHLGSRFYLVKDPGRPRSDYAPLLSLVLPGFDQWYEGQTAYGALYTGMSLSGWGIAVVSPEHKGHAINPGEQVGTAMLLGGGYLSSYHAFQTAAYTRKKLGEYAFLPNEPESPRDLALAPFQVSYFAKPRVSLWLASVAGFLAYANKQDKLFKDYEKNRPDAGSYLTSFVSSSLTGVGEEALFRGYLMPLIRQKSGSDTWALWGQAGLFIPLHSGGNLLVSIPYAFYSGYIVQDNNYRLSEAVFAHAWMNTLGSIFQYYRLDKKKQQSAYITLPPLTVPM